MKRIKADKQESKYFQNLDLNEFSQLPPYAPYLRAWREAKNEFERKRQEQPTRETIKALHERLLQTKYFKVTMKDCTLANYSFEQRGFPLLGGRFPVGPVVLFNLNDPHRFPDCIPLDEKKAESFLNLHPARKADFTFVLENTSLSAVIDDSHGPGGKMETLRTCLATPLQGGALFLLVDYPGAPQEAGRRQVLGVLSSPQAMSSQVLAHAGRAQQILDKLAKPANLQDKEDVLSTYHNGGEVDSFGILAGLLKHGEALGIRLSPEAEAARTRMQDSLDARMQAMAKILNQQRWHDGKFTGSASAYDFSLFPQSYDAATGVLTAKWVQSDGEYTIRGTVKTDAYGPRLEVNTQMKHFLFRLRGDNQFCGGEGIGPTSLGSRAYFHAVGNGESPAVGRRSPRPNGDMKRGGAASTKPASDPASGAPDGAAPAPGAAKPTGVRAERQPRGLRGLLDRFK